MKVIFEDTELEALYEGRKTKGKPQYQPNTVKKLKNTVKTLIVHCERREDLYQFNGLKFKALANHENLYSIRIDDVYRLEFSFEPIENESTEPNSVNQKEQIVLLRMSRHYQK